MGWAERSKKPEGKERESVEAPPKASGCPDFDLAPLKKFSPHIFSSKGYDAADAFILTCSLAFNDLKGVEWLIIQLDKCQPTATGVNAESGQWQGMRLQTTRLVLLILHELLEAIKTADGDAVFEDERFKAAISKLGRSSYARNWSELRSLANGSGETSEVRKYIELVRHNLAAHYYQPKVLFKGYQSYFFEKEPDEFNQFAYASFGNRVEATRFYFADAAVQMAQKLRDPSDRLIKSVHAYTLTMFNALRFLIEAYIHVKEDELAKKEKEA